MSLNISGTGVALITPFKDNKVDFDSFGQIIDYVIDGGVNYVVPMGSTGETAMLNDSESRSILDFVIDRVNKRVPIIAGNFGGNNSKELTSKISSFNFDGVDGILSSSPSYIKPSQEGIYQHYMALSDVSPVPIVLYNVPGRTQSNMEWHTTVRLANASEKFIGIKEATGDLIQATRIIKNKPSHFQVVSGDDEVALPLIACGGDGVISVIANCFPTNFSSMIRAALNNDYAEARRLNNLSYDLHKWLYIEGNPVGIKSAMQSLGFCTNEVRLPLVKMSETNYIKLEEVLNTFKENIEN